MLTSERIAALIQAYADGPGKIEAALAGLSKEELHFKPGPEHWSIHENVVHLADTDLIAASRIRYVLAKPGATLVGYDQNRWAVALDYASRSLQATLALMRAVRASTVEILRRAPAEAWGYAGAHTEYGSQTIEWIVGHFAEHVDGHLATIAKRRQQFAESRR